MKSICVCLILGFLVASPAFAKNAAKAKSKSAKKIVAIALTPKKKHKTLRVPAGVLTGKMPEKKVVAVEFGGSGSEAEMEPLDKSAAAKLNVFDNESRKIASREMSAREKSAAIASAAEKSVPVKAAKPVSDTHLLKQFKKQIENEVEEEY